MGCLPQELSFDIKPTFVSRKINDLLNEVSSMRDMNERLSKLNCLADGLENEMRKIDAYKRELSLCMLILKDAVLFLTEEATSSGKMLPLMEEFMPPTRSSGDEDGKDSIRSVQMWNGTRHDIPSKTSELSEQDEEIRPRSFLQLKTQPLAQNDAVDKLPDPGLSLSPPGSLSSKRSCHRSVSSSAIHWQRNGGIPPHMQQPCRKQRRCWSSELHRKFVNALQQLGGCQVATPKQIRELMQVDGLTNDEVKSHLQKYRLHSTRRRPSSLVHGDHSAGLGGLLLPEERHGHSSKVCSSHSGSHMLRGKIVGGEGVEEDEDAKSEYFGWKRLISR